MHALIIIIIELCKNRTIERMHLPMRGIHIFEKPHYREIRPMRGRPMRGLSVPILLCSKIAFQIHRRYFSRS